MMMQGPAMSAGASSYTFQAAPRAVQGQRTKYREPAAPPYATIIIISSHSCFNFLQGLKISHEFCDLI
jgi:hypothetical protein